MIFIQTVDERAFNAEKIVTLHVNKSVSYGKSCDNKSHPVWDLLASVQGPAMPYVLGRYNTKEHALAAMTSVVLQLDDSTRTRANFIKAPSFDEVE
jgi:hypothetical protein